MNTKSVIIFILGAIIGLIFGKESDLSQEKLILCNFDNELVDWSVPSNKPSTIVFITNDSFETKNDNEMENYKLLVKQNCAKIWHLLENEEIFLDEQERFEMYKEYNNINEDEEYEENLEEDEENLDEDEENLEEDEENLDEEEKNLDKEEKNLEEEKETEMNVDHEKINSIN